jgi:hypothetical protein
MSAAGGAKVDDVAGCGGRGRTLTAASTRSCESSEITADWREKPATGGATGSLPSDFRTMRKVPSAWLKAMALPGKFQNCHKSSVCTGMFSGTRSISLLKCLGPSKCSGQNHSSGQIKHRAHKLRAPLCASMLTTRSTTLSIFCFQCQWPHIFGHVILFPPGWAATTAAAQTMIHCPDTNNSCG